MCPRQACWQVSGNVFHEAWSSWQNWRVKWKEYYQEVWDKQNHFCHAFPCKHSVPRAWKPGVHWKIKPFPPAPSVWGIILSLQMPSTATRFDDLFPLQWMRTDTVKIIPGDFFWVWCVFQLTAESCFYQNKHLNYSQSHLISPYKMFYPLCPICHIKLRAGCWADQILVLYSLFIFSLIRRKVRSWCLTELME